MKMKMKIDENGGGVGGVGGGVGGVGGVGGGVGGGGGGVGVVVVVVGAAALSRGQGPITADRLAEAGLLLVDRRMVAVPSRRSVRVSSALRSLHLPIDFESGAALCLLLRGKDDIFETVARIAPKELDEDVYFSREQYFAIRDRVALFPTISETLERSVIVLHANHNTDEQRAVVERALDENSFVILFHSAEAVFSEEQAFALISHNPIDDKLQEQQGKNMWSDSACAVYVVERLGALDHAALLAGPRLASTAKEFAPNTLCAMLANDEDNRNGTVYTTSGADRIQCDMDVVLAAAGEGSDEKEERFTFPVSYASVVVLPNAVLRSHEIELDLRRLGFTVIAKERVFMSKHRAGEFFARLHADKDTVSAAGDDVAVLASSGEMIALLLAKPAALQSLRVVLGHNDPHLARARNPGSLRGKYGTDELNNAIRAPLSVTATRMCIRELFPYVNLDSVPSEKADIEQYLLSGPPSQPSASDGIGVDGGAKSLQTTLVRALTALAKAKPVGLDAVEWLAVWLRDNNPSRPIVDASTVANDDESDDDDDDDENDYDISNNIRKKLNAGDERRILASMSIVFALGIPGSAYSTLIEQVTVRGSGSGRDSAEHKHDGTPSGETRQETSPPMLLGHTCHLHVPDLLREVARDDSGAWPHSVRTQIKSALDAGLAVSADVCATVIRRALLQRVHTDDRVVLHEFPHTLDQAFMFEKRVCAPSMLLFCDASEEASANTASVEAQRAGLAHLHDYHAYLDLIVPVMDHYAVFGKLRTVSLASGKRDPAARIASALLSGK